MTRIRRGHVLPEIPPPDPAASRGVDHATAAVTDRRGRDAARPRGLLQCPILRARRSGPNVGFGAPARREGNFSSLQTIENKRNRIGIPPNLPTFRGNRCDGGDRLTEPRGAAPRVRPRIVREIGGPADAGRRNFPIRKPLRTREMAKESRFRSSRRFEQAFRGTPRLTPAVSSLGVGRRPVQTRNDGRRLAHLFLSVAKVGAASYKVVTRLVDIGRAASPSGLQPRADETMVRRFLSKART
jgi:hypothetical protein